MKMRISSKGKYALELMVYLGRNYGKGSISISEITGDSFSVKYMEKIAALLNKSKLIKSERGVEGAHKFLERIFRVFADGKVKEVIKTTVDKIMNSILSAFGMRFPLLEEKVKVRINDESGNVK